MFACRWLRPNPLDPKIPTWVYLNMLISLNVSTKEMYHLWSTQKIFSVLITVVRTQKFSETRSKDYRMFLQENLDIKYGIERL